MSDDRAIPEDALMFDGGEVIFFPRQDDHVVDVCLLRHDGGGGHWMYPLNGDDLARLRKWLNS